MKASSPNNTTTSAAPPKEEPQYLYRYMRLDPKKCMDEAELLIRHNTLTLASPQNFNDPFDPAPILSLDGTEDALRAYFRRLAQRKGATRSLVKTWEHNAAKKWRDPKQRKEIEALMASDMTAEFHRLGVYCLSEEYDHILMWSRYADHHRGIVVRFQLDPPTFVSFVASALHVSYQKDRPRIHMLMDVGETRYRKALWPIQNYQWTVYMAQVGDRLQYHVVPMAGPDQDRQPPGDELVCSLVRTYDRDSAQNIRAIIRAGFAHTLGVPA